MRAIKWRWCALPMTSAELEAALSTADALFANNENAALDRILRRLERQILLPPFCWQALLLRGWLHYRRSESEAALRCANTVLAQTDERFHAGKAHLLRALCQEEQVLTRPDVDETKMQPVMAECELAIELLAGHTEQLWAYNELAMLLADWRDPDQGIALLEEALQGSWPEGRDLGWTRARFGEIYALDKHDWRNGAQYLTQAAILLDPISNTHSWVHSLLAQCYNQLREYDRAISHGQRALELAAQDKSSADWVWLRAHKQYATALTRGNGDLRVAEKHFRQAMRLTAKNSRLMAELYLELGNNLRQQDRPRAAWRALNRALRIDKEVAATGSGYSILAEIGFQLKKYQDVVKYVRLALDCKDLPADWLGENYYHLGVSLFKLGQYDEAAEALRTGLSKTPPDHPYRSAMLKWLLAANNRMSRTTSASK